MVYCHRCNITHPMGQHSPSITARLPQLTIRESARHSTPATSSLVQLEQERTQVPPGKSPDYRESLGNVQQPVTTSQQQQSPNTNQVLFHLSTQLDKGTQPTEIQKRFKRNSGRRKQKDGSRIYRGPRSINKWPIANAGSL